jgi:hypothetical protein
MALVLTEVEAYGREIDEPLTKKFSQVLRLKGTGAAGDLTHDIGNLTGTFWTAVGGTDVGAKALTTLKSIVPKIKALDTIGGSTVMASHVLATPQALAAIGDVKVSAYVNGVPSLLYFTAGGPTAWEYLITWDLLDNNSPTKYAQSA